MYAPPDVQEAQEATSAACSSCSGHDHPRSHRSRRLRRRPRPTSTSPSTARTIICGPLVKYLALTTTLLLLADRIYAPATWHSSDGGGGENYFLFATAQEQAVAAGADGGGSNNIFRQLQEKFQQMLKQQQQPLAAEGGGGDEKQAQYAQQQQAQQQLEQQLRNMGRTNPSISIGSDLPRKSRRRVLYELSVRSHYVDGGGGGGGDGKARARSTSTGNAPKDDGTVPRDQRQQQERRQIDLRRTVAALIGGGKGDVVWEQPDHQERDGRQSGAGDGDGDGRSSSAAAGQNSEQGSSADEGSGGSTSNAAAEAEDGCAYYSPPMTEDDIKHGRNMPYWSYRLCPGKSLVQFHVEPSLSVEAAGASAIAADVASSFPEADGATASASASSQRKDRLEERLDVKIAERRKQQVGPNGNDAPLADEMVEVIPTQVLSLGHYVRPTLTSATNILSDDYRSYAQIWGERNAANIRVGPLFVSLEDGKQGEVSYYGGGDQCGKNKYRMSRVVTRSDCCPTESPETAQNEHRLVLKEGVEGNLRILKVEERRPCRYNVLVCNKCLPEEGGFDETGVYPPQPIDIKPRHERGDKVIAFWVDPNKDDTAWYSATVRGYDVTEKRGHYGEGRTYHVEFDDGDEDYKLKDAYVISQKDYYLEQKGNALREGGVTTVSGVGDEYAETLGWYKTSFTGDKVFGRLSDAVKARDEKVVEDKGQYVTEADLLCPEDWDFPKDVATGAPKYTGRGQIVFDHEEEDKGADTGAAESAQTDTDNDTAKSSDSLQSIPDTTQDVQNIQVTTNINHLADYSGGNAASAQRAYLRRLPNESSNVLPHELLQQHSPHDSTASSFPPFPNSKAQSNLESLQTMFQHSYDAYMYNAYPSGELRPTTCGPGSFDLVRLPALTLIDSLDTLVIMGNFTEFARSVERLRELDEVMQEEFESLYPNFIEPSGLPERNGGLFGVNQNVSLFETNIRVLGGLLSGHQLAEAFLSEGSVRHSDVWDEHGNIRIGESAIGISDAMSSVDTQIGQIDDVLEKETCAAPWDEKSRGSCPSDDSSANPPPCAAFDYFEDIGECKKLMKRVLNTTSKSKKGNRPNNIVSKPWKYDGLFLTLAHDLGIRLLPAYATETGIPYGTVNLLLGIPPGETSVASLAGGGTLSIEMELLSRLTGDGRFGQAARLATRALWARRSSDLDLLGKHIDVHTGKWMESLSGVGSNSDSFYEYLIKHHILFPDDVDYYDLWIMFLSTYNGVFYDNRMGDWYGDVEMQGGRQLGSRNIFESLMAFWPGMQVLLGELNPAARSANAFSLVRELLGMLPERFDFGNWRVDAGGGVSPLRPELLESIYFLHMASGGINLAETSVDGASNSTAIHTGWQWASDFALHTLKHLTETECGHASVKEVHQSTTGSIISSFLHAATNENAQSPFDASSNHLLDDMPSYFLSETIKYLYLTFDGDDNILHQDKERDWVFTTEAHPVHYVPPALKKQTRHRQEETDDFARDDSLADAKQRILALLSDEISAHNIEEDGNHDMEYEPSMCSFVEGSTDLRLQQSKKLSEKESKWTPQTPYGVFNELISNVENVVQKNKGALRDIRSEQSDTHLAPHRLVQPISSPYLALMGDMAADDEVLAENLSTLTGHWLGRGEGSNLAQSCPNHHHPDLRWVYALNGESLDYGDSFVTYMSDAVTTAAHRIESRQASELSSAASYGIVTVKSSVIDPDRMCQIIEDEQVGNGGPKATTQESPASTQESTREAKERGLELTRVDMGAPLGQFDVSALTEEVGFFVRHVKSGVSVEATILEDESGKGESLMVVTDSPPSKQVTPKVDKYPTIRPGLAWSWNKMISRRNRTLRKGAGGQKGEDANIPYQRRKTTFAHSNGSAFECNVRLSRGSASLLPDKNGGATTRGDILAIFPCSPAQFGQTSVENLVEKDGLQVQGVIVLPDPLDEYGCTNASEAIVQQSKIEGSDAEHMQQPQQTQQNETTIQLTRRGTCRFQTKASNQARAGGRSGMIVINSDSGIFVMSGGCSPEEKNCEEERADSLLIPSVLVGKSDGEKIMQIAEDVAKSGGVLRATINLLPANDGAVTNPQKLQLPAISMSSDAVQILAPKGWGLHAVRKQLDGESIQQQQQQQQSQQKSQKDEDPHGKPRKSEWQLFILQHQH